LIKNKQPPKPSKNILGDIKYYFFHSPETPTRVVFRDKEERQRYCRSILQRTGIGVDKYSVLNIHKIGVDAPALYVFDELLKWDGNSMYWPNHLARVNLQDGKMDKIKIFLFGLKKHALGLKNGLFGIHFLHLFDMDAIDIQHTPAPFDFDNARYLLYKCSGGYPIGVFSMYVRTSIPERGEKEMSQLFSMVGFNFYGNKKLAKYNILNKTWEAIHNRATANIVNRFKKLCEWRFEEFVNQTDIK